jgi:M6 family metalloprotease-like protein
MSLRPFSSRSIPKLVLALILTTLSAWQSAQAQCCGADSSSFKQPDGTAIEIHFHGNELYTRTVSADGYTLVFDHTAGAYFYADLDAKGDAFVSTGKLAKPAKPAGLNVRRNLELNPEARRKLAEKRSAELEAVRQDKMKWQSQKQMAEDHRSWKKKVKEAEEKRKNPNKDGANSGDASFQGGIDGQTTQDSEGPELAPPVNPPTLGNVLGLTILVDFSDVPGRSDVTRADFDDYCNKPGGRAGWGNKGSIYDYFHTQSNGRLRYRNNVTYYVRVPNTYAYYNNTSVAQNSGTNGRRLLTDALNVLIAQGYDFSGLAANSQGRVIATNLLWAGNDSGVWASGLWPHRWSLSTPLSVGGGLSIFDYQCTNIGSSGNPTMGTFCHEDGHLIGKYPDYYDTNGGSEGVGNHCLMGAGNHATGTNPTNISSYLKFHSGWIDAVELKSLTPPIRLAAPVDGTTVFKYTNATAGWTNEYFLIENRSKIGGWEATSGLPDSGLMISHIHETGSNQNEQRSESQHYEHSIVQADGLFQLETNANRGNNGDYFHSDGTDGPKTEFNDTTGPNAKWWQGAVAGDNTTGTNSGLQIHSVGTKGAIMSFVYGTGTPSGAATTRLTTSIFENAVDFGTNAPNQTFAVYNSGGGTVNYTISDNVTWLSVNTASGDATAETDTITVSYTSSALAAGTYPATITVNGGTAGTQTIAVTLTVRNQPTLSVTPGSLSISGIAGTTGYTDDFDLRNTGGGTAAYTVTKTQSWLTLLPTTGTVSAERDTIIVNCNATSLAAGTYNDTITVTSTAATNSPLTIPVTFTVQSADMILTSPNGGEKWDRGTTQVITWLSGIGGNVKIELFNNGVLSSTIAASTTNDGSHSWSIPTNQTPGSNYRIRITSVETPGTFDQSFADFTIVPPPIYYASMDTNPGWTLDTGWAYGQPTGAGQDAYGGPDPTSGQNGPNVIGYRLDGDYEASLTSTRWATTPVINCSGNENVTLSFQRWLGVETSQWDKAYIEVSNNGTTWTQIWANPASDVNDSAWGYFEYDISAVADNQATVFIRWGLGATDASWNYCGWNIDEVRVEGDLLGGTLAVTPAGNMSSSGAIGGPFSPSSQIYTLTNSGSMSINWTAAKTANWVTLDATSGTLAAGATTQVTVSVNANANVLTPASYSDTVTFENATNGLGNTTRSVGLTVVPLGNLTVTPAGNLSASGVYGGPFSSPSQIYTLTNSGSTSINWTAAKTQDWVTLSAPSGTLAAGASTSVTASINANANTLNVGSYSDTVTFTNTTNGTGNTTRGVSLTINPIVATVNLSNLLQTYDGFIKPVTVTTTPSGLAHSVTYNGSSTVPTNGGTYAVVATITEPNYSGSASGNLDISYTVTYQGNGNTSGTVPAAQTKFHDVNLTLATNSGNLNKTDFSFSQWNTAADGSGTAYPAGGTYSGNVSLILYAQWVTGANGTWIQTAAGPFNWGDIANWSGGTVAAGADRTASFTPNITAAQTVNLESARTIGNISFTDSTTASHDLTISGANILTLSRTSGTPTIDVTQSGRLLTIGSVIAGSNGLKKSGAGTLVLGSGSNNTFTGGFEINAGAVQYESTTSANAWGASSNVITFSGTSSLYNNNNAYTLARAITINDGVTASLTGAFGETTNVTGVVGGTGTLKVEGSSNGWALTLSNTTNTFTGPIQILNSAGTSSLSVASLGSSSNAVTLSNTGNIGTFTYTGSAAVSRPFVMAGTTGGSTINASGAGALTASSFSVTGAGVKTLTLDGSSSATNQISGNIINNGGNTSVTKTGSGIWALGGTNSYSGDTNLAASGTTGVLVFQGSQALSGNTTLKFAQNSSNVQSVRFLDNGTGTISFNRPIEFGGGNTSQNLNIAVGNNNTNNGGSSSGTTTGSTIQVGNITFTSTATDTGTTTLNATSPNSNGYRLQTGAITLNNLVTRTFNSTTVTVLNPTTANMTVAAITMATGNTGTANDGVPVLRLDGTATDNIVTGNVTNASDYLTGQALSLQKQGTGNWALNGSGNNFTGTITFTGTTASGGRLSFASASGTNPITFNATTGFGSTLTYTGASPLTMSGLITASALTTGGILFEANGTAPTAAINYSNTSSLSTTNTSTSTRYITFGGANTGDNTFAGTINNNTGVNGSAQVAKVDAGKWVLTGNGNYTGGIFINNGTVSVNSIPNGTSTSPLGANSRINLGRDNTTAALIYTGGGNSTNRDLRLGGPSTFSGTGGGAILNDGTGALIFTAATFNATQTGILFNRTLTLSGSYTGAVNEIQGIIQNNTATTGLVNLEKTGDSTWRLSGANTYSGTTTVSAGTLEFGANNVLPNASAITLADAILNASTFTDVAGTLDVTSTATINLGSGAALAFADSSSIDWTSGSLNITGTFVSGSSIRFGITSGGLTPTQLALISTPGVGPVALDPNGYLVNVPTITLTGAPVVAVNTTFGIPSPTPTYFSVSGSNLIPASGSLTIAALAGFEYATSVGGTYTTTLLIPYTGGALSSTDVFVRLAANASVDGSPYSGNCSVSGGGAATKTIATVSSTVSKATPTVIVTVASYTYNGSAQGPSAYSSNPTGNTGVPMWIYEGTGGTTYGPSPTRPTGAGNYTATVALAADSNFNAASSIATSFIIAKAPSIVTVTVGSYTYNGSAQGPTSYSTDPTGNTGTPTWSYAGAGATTYGPSETRPSDAGTYTATVALTADSNFDAASSSATAFTIAKAVPTVTVTVGSYTYSGLAQGPSAYTTSPTGNTGAPTWSYAGTGVTTYGPSATLPTDAGSYTATVALAADSNFDAASSSATAFTIANGNPYLAWAGAAAFDADTNNDGVDNGLAWLLGATDPSTNAANLLPTFDNASDPEYFIYTYRRSDSANTSPNTTIAVQYGSGLNGWSTAVAGPDIIITPTDDFYGTSPGVDKVELKIKRTLAPAGRFFVRLNVAAATP